MSDRELERLAQALGEWARRPPRRSPRTARARVLARLPRRRRRRARWLVPVAATLAAAALALLLAIGRRDEPPAAAPGPTAGGQPTIVHALSSGTPLYIVLHPAPEAAPPVPEDPLPMEPSEGA